MRVLVFEGADSRVSPLFSSGVCRSGARVRAASAVHTRLRQMQYTRRGACRGGGVIAEVGVQELICDQISLLLSLCLVRASPHSVTTLGTSLFPHRHEFGSGLVTPRPDQSIFRVRYM